MSTGTSAASSNNSQQKILPTNSSSSNSSSNANGGSSNSAANTSPPSAREAQEQPVTMSVPPPKSPVRQAKPGPGEAAKPQPPKPPTAATASDTATAHRRTPSGRSWFEGLMSLPSSLSSSSAAANANAACGADEEQQQAAAPLFRLPSQDSLDRSMHNDSGHGNKSAAQIILELKKNNSRLTQKTASMEVDFMNEMDKVNRRFSERETLIKNQLRDAISYIDKLEAHCKSLEKKRTEDEKQLTKLMDESAYSRHTISSLRTQIHQLEQGVDCNNNTNNSSNNNNNNNNNSHRSLAGEPSWKTEKQQLLQKIEELEKQNRIQKSQMLASSSSKNIIDNNDDNNNSANEDDTKDKQQRVALEEQVTKLTARVKELQLEIDSSEGQQQQQQQWNDIPAITAEANTANNTAEDAANKPSSPCASQPLVEAVAVPVTDSAAAAAGGGGCPACAKMQREVNLLEETRNEREEALVEQIQELQKQSRKQAQEQRRQKALLMKHSNNATDTDNNSNGIEVVQSDAGEAPVSEESPTGSIEVSELKVRIHEIAAQLADREEENRKIQAAAVAAEKYREEEAADLRVLTDAQEEEIDDLKRKLEQAHEEVAIKDEELVEQRQQTTEIDDLKQKLEEAQKEMAIKDEELVDRRQQTTEIDDLKQKLEEAQKEMAIKDEELVDQRQQAAFTEQVAEDLVAATSAASATAAAINEDSSQFLSPNESNESIQNNISGRNVHVLNESNNSDDHHDSDTSLHSNSNENLKKQQKEIADLRDVTEKQIEDIEDLKQRLGDALNQVEQGSNVDSTNSNIDKEVDVAMTELHEWTEKLQDEVADLKRKLADAQHEIEVREAELDARAAGETSLEDNTLNTTSSTNPNHHHFNDSQNTSGLSAQEESFLTSGDSTSQTMDGDEAYMEENARMLHELQSQLENSRTALERLDGQLQETKLDHEQQIATLQREVDEVVAERDALFRERHEQKVSLKKSQDACILAQQSKQELQEKYERELAAMKLEKSDPRLNPFASFPTSFSSQENQSQDLTTAETGAFTAHSMATTRMTNSNFPSSLKNNGGAPSCVAAACITSFPEIGTEIDEIPSEDTFPSMPSKSFSGEGNSRMSTNQNKMTDLQDKLRDRDTTISALVKSSTNLEEQVSAAQMEIELLNTQLERYRSGQNNHWDQGEVGVDVIIAPSPELERFKEELESAREREKGLAQQVQQFREHLEATRKENALLHSRLDNDDVHDLSAMQERLTQQNQLVDNLKQELRRVRSELVSLRKQQEQPGSSASSSPNTKSQSVGPSLSFDEVKQLQEETEMFAGQVIEQDEEIENLKHALHDRENRLAATSKDLTTLRHLQVEVKELRQAKIKQEEELHAMRDQAREFKAYEDDLTQLEHSVKTAERDIDEYKRITDQLKREKTEALETASRERTAFEQFRDQARAQLKEENASLQRNLDSQTSAMDSAKGIIQNLERMLAEKTASEMAAQDQEKEELLTEIENLQSQLDEARHSIDEIEGNRAIIDEFKEFHSYEQKLEEQDVNHDKLRKEIAKAKKDLTEQEEAHACEIAKCRQEATDEHKRLTAELQRREARIVALERTLHAQEELVANMRMEMDHLQGSMTNATATRREETENMQQELVDLTTTAARQEREISLLRMKLEDENAAHQIETKKLLDTIEALENEASDDTHRSAADLQIEVRVREVKERLEKLRRRNMSLNEENNTLREQLDIAEKGAAGSDKKAAALQRQLETQIKIVEDLLSQQDAATGSPLTVSDGNSKIPIRVPPSPAKKKSSRGLGGFLNRSKGRPMSASDDMRN